MQEGSDLAEHINVFNQLIVDLGKVDVKIDEEDKAIILLCSLPGSYEHLVTTLTYGKEDVKVDEIVTTLLGHEQRRKNNLSEDSSGGVFVVGCDHSAGDKKGNKKKKGPQCYKCKGWGHKKAECPELKKGGGTASVMIAKKQDDSDSDGDILTVSSESPVKRGCWIRLARFMQHQRRSGSRHTLRRMVALLTWEMIRVIVS